MDGSQVTFGRRGIDPSNPSAPNGHAAQSADHPSSRPVSSHGNHAAAAAMPSAIVNRSIAKVLMCLAAALVLFMVMAGSSKHSADLPYWMRHDGKSHAEDYARMLAIYLGIALLVILPVLRRPTALQLFDDHFEYLGLFGAPRVVRWSDVSEVSNSVWAKYLRIKLNEGGTIRIYKYGLDHSASEVVDLLESGRVSAGNRRMQFASRELASEYLFPGH